MQLFPTPQSPIANQLYNNFIALLVRLYPQRLGDLLHQHCAFSTAMSISEKLQKVDRLKRRLDSFRPLSPTLVAEWKKLYDVRFTYQCFTELSQTYSSLTIQPGFIPEGL